MDNKRKNDAVNDAENDVENDIEVNTYKKIKLYNAEEHLAKLSKEVEKYIIIINDLKEQIAIKNNIISNNKLQIHDKYNLYI